MGRGPVPRRVVVRSDASSDASAVGRQPLSLWPRRPRRGCAGGALSFQSCRDHCRAGTCGPPAVGRGRGLPSGVRATIFSLISSGEARHRSAPYRGEAKARRGTGPRPTKARQRRGAAQVRAVQRRGKGEARHRSAPYKSVAGRQSLERRIFRCVGRRSLAVVVVAPAPSPGVRRRRTVVPSCRYRCRAGTCAPPAVCRGRGRGLPSGVRATIFSLISSGEARHRSAPYKGEAKAWRGTGPRPTRARQRRGAAQVRALQERGW
jgi:hypothetical protein